MSNSARSKFPGSHEQASEIVQMLLADPSQIEPGLEILEIGFPLTSQSWVDVVALDQDGIAVIMIVRAENETNAAYLGRVMTTFSEFSRLRPLLEHHFSAQEFSMETLRLFVVADRLSEGLLTTLGNMTVPVTALEVPRQSIRRWEFGAEPTAATPAPTTVTPAAAKRTAANLPAEKQTPAPAESKVASPVNGHAAPTPESPRSLSLIDEAKKKILRVSDDVQEQVDGDLTRFLVRDRVLATLTTGEQGFSIYVGDQPDQRRPIRDKKELDQALDDVLRRYYFLLQAVPNARER